MTCLSVSYIVEHIRIIIFVQVMLSHGGQNLGLFFSSPTAAAVFQGRAIISQVCVVL